MTRERAREAFWTTWVAGFAVGLLARLVDPPEAARWPVVGVYSLTLATFGGIWLWRAIQDGALKRAVPEYLLAFLGLLLIAAACGLVTLLVLLAIGEPVETTDVSSGAALGTFAVLGLYWLAQARGDRRRGRAESSS